MKRGPTGRYQVTKFSGEAVRAFVPHPLPPSPPVVLSGVLQDLLDHALVACGRLDALTTILPNPDFFLYSYVRREAVLSSQIEGTQSSLSDLLLYEQENAAGNHFDDVIEVSNYVAALERGLHLVTNELPLSGRLIREVHAELLREGRGADKHPGEFRTSQNWIGGGRPGNALFVPPPPDQVLACMGDLEQFMNARGNGIPVLVRAALTHVQFETIHPFLDGNGRTGRLLIAVQLSEAKVLTRPLLYLSLYFKRHRSTYYDLLNTVREHGDYEAWLDFFLTGVRETADEAVAMARRLLELNTRHKEEVLRLPGVSASATRVLDALTARPMATITSICARTGLSTPTVGRVLERLLELGLVREVTGRKRNQVFAYSEYLATLSEGDEPL